MDGWTLVGTSAGALAVVLVVAGRKYLFETVAGVALLVATAGFQLAIEEPGVRIDVSYGAKLGFAALALMVVAGISSAAWSRPDRLALLAPAAVCVVYLGVVTVTWWGILPRRADEDLRFAPVSWLTIVGILAALVLLRAWWTAAGGLLVALPLSMLGLATVDLVRLRDQGIEWGGGLVVGLCLVLILLGAIEREGGLESLRVPEILRVDRL